MQISGSRMREECCLIGATDVFLDSVANSAVFPRNWASFTPVPRKGELQLRVAVFWASVYAHAAIFKKKHLHQIFFT